MCEALSLVPVMRHGPKNCQHRDYQVQQRKWVFGPAHTTNLRSIFACTKLGIDDPTAVDHWPDAAQVMPWLKGRPDKVDECYGDITSVVVVQMSL